MLFLFSFLGGDHGGDEDGDGDDVILPAGEGKWGDALWREDQANQEEGWNNIELLMIAIIFIEANISTFIIQFG